MFLKWRLKTQSGVAIGTTIAALAALGSGACSDSTAGTDLRPEGPPDVLAVLVLNDSVSGLVEAATYCKTGDEKRPSLVGLPDFTTTTLCPTDANEAPSMVSDASPDTFYVRLVFDELLNPNIETLDPILDDNGLETGQFTGSLRDSLPVTLKCTGIDGQLHDIAYDGYYSPSGNAVTWPVGPSLVIKPTRNVIVPTNADCEVAIKDGIVFDKQGEPVPSSQLGPFKFKISPIKPLFVDPSDSGDPEDPTAVDAFAIYSDNAYTQFNTEVQVPSLCTDDGFGTLFFNLPPSLAAVCKSSMPVAFDIAPHETGGCSDTLDPCAADGDCNAGETCDFFYAYSLAPFGLTSQEYAFGPIYPIQSDKDYTFTYKQSAVLKDRCAAPTTFGAPDPDALTSVAFHTNKFDLKTTTFSINNNDKPAPNRKPRFSFTNVLDLSTIDPATEVTIDPLPFADATTPIDPAVDYPDSNTENDIFLSGFYKPDTDYTVTIKGGSKFADAYGAEYTHAAADTVIKFHTQAIALTASSPASGATITKATPTTVSTISFTFNQDMDVSTFTADDIELTGAATTLSFSVGSTRATGCSYRSTGCQLRVRGTFTPGDYTLKLKAGAVIKDQLGNDYTQAADRVIKFTVEEAEPSTPVPCLGS
jgi:hypothetical protein